MSDAFGDWFHIPISWMTVRDDEVRAIYYVGWVIFFLVVR